MEITKCGLQKSDGALMEGTVKAAKSKLALAGLKRGDYIVAIYCHWHLLIMTEPIAIFELLCQVRLLLSEAISSQLSWEDMASRVCIARCDLNNFTNVVVVGVYIGDLMFNGTPGAECWHFGLCENPSLPTPRYHGTNDWWGLVTSGGIQEPSTRPLKNMPGWYHFPLELWWRPLEYAPPMPANPNYRCVCEYDCRCYI